MHFLSENQPAKPNQPTQKVQLGGTRRGEGADLLEAGQVEYE
jgi:hypothetical protein